MGNITDNLAAFLHSAASDLVIEKRETPSPGPGELLIRNHFIALNPVDWKRQTYGYLIPSYPVLLGSDVSGTVEKVGPQVTAFKEGDRVLGFADSFETGINDHAAFQTYTIISEDYTAAIPAAMTFQEAVTLPQGLGTVTMALFDVLDLPKPTGSPISSSGDYILIWGAASSVGWLAVQMAQLSGLTVFAIASKHNHDSLLALGAAAAFDYHSPTVVDDIVAAAKKAGKTIKYALDTISLEESIAPVTQVLEKTKKSGSPQKFAHTLSWPESIPKPEGLYQSYVLGQDIWTRRLDLSKWLCREFLPVYLEKGSIKPLKHRVVEGGLGGLQDALNQLKNGVSGEKLVVEL